VIPLQHQLQNSTSCMHAADPLFQANAAGANFHPSYIFSAK